MASSFSANQYENAFKSQKLQNWTQPKVFRERPKAMDGHTRFIATDRGHLLPGMKAKKSRWTFVGTWELPREISRAQINPTARSQEGQERLRIWGQEQRGSRRRSTSDTLEKTAAEEECGGNKKCDSQLSDHMESATNLVKAEDTNKVSPHLEVDTASPRPASQLSKPSSRCQAETHE